MYDLIKPVFELAEGNQADLDYTITSIISIFNGGSNVRASLTIGNIKSDVIIIPKYSLIGEETPREQQIPYQINEFYSLQCL